MGEFQITKKLRVKLNKKIPKKKIIIINIIFIIKIKLILTEIINLIPIMKKVKLEIKEITIRLKIIIILIKIKRQKLIIKFIIMKIISQMINTAIMITEKIMEIITDQI